MYPVFGAAVRHSALPNNAQIPGWPASLGKTAKVLKIDECYLGGEWLQDRGAPSRV